MDILVEMEHGTARLARAVPFLSAAYSDRIGPAIHDLGKR